LFVGIAFYIVSLFLVYFDCKRYIVPNELILVLFLFVVVFGIIDSSLGFFSLVLPVALLVLFWLISLTKLGYVGGGDIKYLLVVALYLEPLVFAIFLVMSGVLQLLFLVFYKKVKKRRFAPMIPAMVVAVALSEVAYRVGVFPL
jgi:leader peptidase (prepilin peptidase) / N-methyltransferase